MHQIYEVVNDTSIRDLGQARIPTNFVSPGHIDDDRPLA